MTQRWIVACIVAGLTALPGPATASEKPAPARTAPQVSALSQTSPRLDLPCPSLTASLNARPRNVILFIGDGMGFAQITSARIRTLGPDGRFTMDQLPVTGVATTHSANNLVPDSAACGTAMACGVKTANGMIGQTPAARFQSILEAAKARGMRTGLVVTKNLTDATPASFAAHVASRKMEPTIARQLLAARVNVLFGGGRRYFLPRASSPSQVDPNDLAPLMQANGYLCVLTSAQLQEAKADRVIGLFAYEAMRTRAPEPTLAIMTEKAISLLSRPRSGGSGAGSGLFLMVEGSQIDTASHNNDPNQMVRQITLFDQAIQKGVEFAQRDGHTLVIVTADHETGGLEIVPPKAKAKTTAKDPNTAAGATVSAGTTAAAAAAATTASTSDEEGEDDDYQDPNALVLNLKWTGKDHTGMPVPVYAYGPGCLEFTGVMDNTEIPQKIARLLGIEGFPRRVPEAGETTRR